MSAQEMRNLLNQLNESTSDKRATAIQILESLKSDLVNETKASKDVINVIESYIDELKSTTVVIDQEWIDGFYEDVVLSTEDNEHDEIFDIMGTISNDLYKLFGIDIPW